MKIAAKEIFDLLENHKGANVIITTHHKPDADAIGSSLGLYLFLSKMNLNVTVITPTDFAGFLHWMKGAKEIVNFEGNESTCDELTKNADFIICLDFNHLSRINEYGEMVANAKAKKILIDHHQFPQGFEDYTYWDDKASSTCELVYRWIKDVEKEQQIDQYIASCLYTGIMTDTGSFRFSNCSADTHQIVANLMHYGVDHVWIHDKIYDSFTEDRVKFIGYAISQKLEVLPEFHTAIITIDRDELKKYKIQTGDTEGLVNYGLSIEGIKFAILVIDRTKMVKMSFRSKGKFAANQFAMNHFNGGGHFNAAGGSSNLSFNETVTAVKDTLKLYQKQLQNDEE